MCRAIAVSAVSSRHIRRMREDYRREMNCQIVHDSYHSRGFTDSYMLRVDGQTAAYGSVAGPPGQRDVIKEFYVVSDWRGLSVPLFRQLIAASEALFVEAQSNDPFLYPMLLDHGVDVTSDTVVFADKVTTNLSVANAAFRRLTRRERARAFQHVQEPVGEWGVEYHDEIVGTGGLLFHYNRPYGDIYMEVDSRHRGKGFGSLLVQELKRIAYEDGHVPAARCNSDNVASAATLQRAGMTPCAQILRARLAADELSELA